MPARRGDVLACGRGGIVGRCTDGEDRPDRARRDGLVCRTVAGVEAPLEADLHEDPGTRDLLDHAVECRQLECHGLLAEGRDARLSGEPQQRRVARCCGGDDERVDTCRDKCLR